MATIVCYIDNESTYSYNNRGQWHRSGNLKTQFSYVNMDLNVKALARTKDLTQGQVQERDSPYVLKENPRQD